MVVIPTIRYFRDLAAMEFFWQLSGYQPEGYCKFI